MALVLDGKTFAQDCKVVVLRVMRTGEKKLLGFGQTATEDQPVCADFLRILARCGLRRDGGRQLRGRLRRNFDLVSTGHLQAR